jgi:hypothetical protein
MAAYFAVLVDGQLDGESLRETQDAGEAYFREWYSEDDERVSRCIVDVRVVDVFKKAGSTTKPVDDFSDL